MVKGGDKKPNVLTYFGQPATNVCTCNGQRQRSGISSESVLRNFACIS